VPVAESENGSCRMSV